MSFRLGHKWSFFVFMAAGVALRYIPYLGVWLKWFETFFHEASHGLVSMAFGGYAHEMVIRVDGSGQIMVGGGVGPLTSFAGYAGAVVWGCAVYAIASNLAPRSARWLACVMAGLGGVAELFWVSFSDVVTLGIIAGIVASMVLLASRRAAGLARPCLRLVGANVAVTAMVTPTYVLHQGVGHNDAEALAAALLLPQWVWVALWLIWGALCIYLTWRTECLMDHRLTRLSPLTGDTARLTRLAR